MNNTNVNILMPVPFVDLCIQYSGKFLEVELIGS